MFRFTRRMQISTKSISEWRNFMTKNKQSTKYYSSLQENNIAKQLGGCVQPASGAGHWNKSDVVINNASLSIECKTTVTPKESFSIKKDWIKKQKEEAFCNRLSNTALAISFEPEGQENYYVIDQKLMKFLVQKLIEENN